MYALPAGDSQLKGGQAVFDSQAGIILYADTGSDFDRAFLIAHELGHIVLEGGTLDIVTAHVEPDRSVEDAPVGIEKVLDYGARERREVRGSGGRSAWISSLGNFCCRARWSATSIYTTAVLQQTLQRDLVRHRRLFSSSFWTRCCCPTTCWPNQPRNRLLH